MKTAVNAGGRREGGRRRSPLLPLAFLSLLVPGGCIHPRYAHHSVDRYAFSRGTASASGWLDPSPDPPVARLSQVAPDQRLVLSCTDFDRGVAFEAILTPRASGGFLVLTLTHGQPGGASPEQLAFLASLLEVGIERLAPAADAGEYRAVREGLERAIAADPARGLAALAACSRPLFPSDAAEMLGRALRHAKATPAVVSAAVDLAACRQEAGAGLRGWIRAGGASRLVEQALQEPACTREIAMGIAADALAGRIRGDREIVLLGILRRKDLAAADLQTLLAGALKEVPSFSERRNLVTEIVRHPAADAGVLAAAVGAVDSIVFSSDRRRVLLAVLDVAAPRPPAREAVLLSVVKAAYEKLDYDDDREEVLVVATAHPSATEAVRSAIRAGLDKFRFPRPRGRVEAVLPR